MSSRRNPNDDDMEDLDPSNILPEGTRRKEAKKVRGRVRNVLNEQDKDPVKGQKRSVYVRANKRYRLDYDPSQVSRPKSSPAPRHNGNSDSDSSNSSSSSSDNEDSDSSSDSSSSSNDVSDTGDNDEEVKKRQQIPSKQLLSTGGGATHVGSPRYNPQQVAMSSSTDTHLKKNPIYFSKQSHNAMSDILKGLPKQTTSKKTEKQVIKWPESDPSTNHGWKISPAGQSKAFPSNNTRSGYNERGEYTGNSPY